MNSSKITQDFMAIGQCDANHMTEEQIEPTIQDQSRTPNPSTGHHRTHNPTIGSSVVRDLPSLEPNTLNQGKPSNIEALISTVRNPGSQDLENGDYSTIPNKFQNEILDINNLALEKTKKESNLDEGTNLILPEISKNTTLIIGAKNTNFEKKDILDKDNITDLALPNISEITDLDIRNGIIPSKDSAPNNLKTVSIPILSNHSETTELECNTSQDPSKITENGKMYSKLNIKSSINPATDEFKIENYLNNSKNSEIVDLECKDDSTHSNNYVDVDDTYHIEPIESKLKDKNADLDSILGSQGKDYTILSKPQNSIDLDSLITHDSKLEHPTEKKNDINDLIENFSELNMYMQGISNYLQYKKFIR